MDWEKQEKFSIRKLSVGVASVLVGQMFVSQGQEVKADEVAGLVEDSSLVSSESSPTAASDVVTNVESANIGGGVPLELQVA